MEAEDQRQEDSDQPVVEEYIKRAAYLTKKFKGKKKNSSKN